MRASDSSVNPFCASHVGHVLDVAPSGIHPTIASGQPRDSTQKQG